MKGRRMPLFPSGLGVGPDSRLGVVGLGLAAVVLTAAGCSYQGGFVNSSQVVVHIGEESPGIRYDRTVSGVAKANPSYCAPSAPIALYKKAMERLHEAAELKVQRNTAEYPP
jgi:arginine/lysine/ornithine decarboxylase